MAETKLGHGLANVPEGAALIPSKQQADLFLAAIKEEFRKMRKRRKEPRGKRKT